MKECSTCKKEKPLDKFHNNSSMPDGKAYSCKECKNNVRSKIQERYKEKWRDKNPREKTPNKIKECSKCGEKKKYIKFNKNSSKKDGLSNQCKNCQNKQAKEYRKRIKKKVIKAYGGQCECCGITNIGFLTIDHVNDNRKEHIKELDTFEGSAFYSKLYELNYPDNYNLRILCYNCNCGRERNGGICPHND